MCCSKPKNTLPSSDIEQKTKKMMCLCFPFISGSLGSVEHRLVILVYSWHVHLRKGDVTDDTHVLPTLLNLSKHFNHHRSLSLKVWLNNVSTTDPVGPRPLLLNIAPIQLSLRVYISREWRPTLHLLFRVRLFINEQVPLQWLLKKHQ